MATLLNISLMVSVRYYSVTVHRDNGKHWYYLIPITQIEVDMLNALIENNGGDFYNYLSYTYTPGDTETDLSDKWDINYNKLRPYKVEVVHPYHIIESSFEFVDLD